MCLFLATSAHYLSSRTHSTPTPTLLFILQINQYELTLCKKTEELAQVENALSDAEANIQNAIVISANKNEENLLLQLFVYGCVWFIIWFLQIFFFRRLQDEKDTNDQLVNQLKDNERSMQKLEDKIFELREKLCEANDTNKKLKENNEELNRDLQEAKVIVEEMRTRPWYKNAGELAKGSLVALQYAAFLMLPALPQHLGKK